MINRVLSICVVAVLFTSYSCEQDNYLAEGDLNDIRIALSCKKIEQVKDNDHYYVRIKDSGLKTDFGKKMGASLTSLILYERAYENNSSISYGSTFGVEFIGDTVEYSYSLNELAKIKKGKETVEEVINRLTQDSSVVNYFYRNGSDKSDIDWVNSELVGAIGFEDAMVNLGEDQITTILFRYSVEPTNEEAWFYYLPTENKIVSIIDPRKNSASYQISD